MFQIAVTAFLGISGGVSVCWAGWLARRSWPTAARVSLWSQGRPGAQYKVSGVCRAPRCGGLTSVPGGIKEPLFPRAVWAAGIPDGGDKQWEEAHVPQGREAAMLLSI